MPKPEEVNPKNFIVETILYNHESFSVAYGCWDDDYRCLAVRWDGEENRSGFPQTFGRPMWLIIPQELTIPILKGFLDKDVQSDKKEILELLRQLIVSSGRAVTAT